MKPHLQTLVDLLVKNDVKGMVEFYQSASEAENLGQLALLYNQGQKKPKDFEIYQQLAAKCIATKGLPKALISKINHSDLLTFFTPALQSNWHFTRTDEHGRNVLHYLLLGSQQNNQMVHPPFLYLRSLMLFETNEVLQEALIARDKQELTPMELYMSGNQNLSALPNHEFTAVLALIEFQSNQNAIDNRHFATVLSGVRELCFEQAVAMGDDLQRLQFIAYFYRMPIEQILERLKM